MSFINSALIILFFSGLCGIAEAQTPSESPSAALTRFTYALDNLQKVYSGKTVDITLARSGFQKTPGMQENPRQLLFRLESLFRLYQDSNPDLSSEFLQPVKDLEDAIGHYGDTQDFLAKARGADKPDADYLAKMKKNDKHALANIETVLADWTAPTHSPMVDKIRAAVTPVFSNTTSADDRKTLISKMLELITTLQTKNFDMTKLETGIHELRRQARWVEYYTYAMGGMVIWDQTETHAACPADAKAAGFNAVKLDPYELATPIAPVAVPCYISACLGAEISHIQNALSDLKENAELGNASAARDVDFASPEVIQQATDLYAQLLGKNGGPKMLDELRAQLQSCLQ